MSDHIFKTIEDLRLKLGGQEQAVVETKKLINSLSKLVGQPEPYVDVDSAPMAAIGSIRADQFYGQPMATAVRQILEMRKVANIGPASVTEIYDTLTRGGYLFDTKDADNAKRGLRISLTKNPVFHRVPTGEYGLTVWYPNIREKRVHVDEEPEAKTTATSPGGAVNDAATPKGSAKNS